ncbi:MAG: DUF3048 domain-containing protein [Atribacterota bacterium]|jgi:outer membrane biosynthesis protein TonB|nr:DUF3048 domain-containing protein [Atribacterota bacterium]MDY0382597.1 DUF3048 domain-containing protein [Atribacterota bacterium]
MAGYRAKRRKIRSKSFLGRSFLISLILNIIFILFFNNLISFDFINIPEIEELIMVTLVELPSVQKPTTVRPEIVREEPIAEVSVRPRVEPALPEPAKTQEIETQPKVEKEEVQLESGPRVEVKMPEIDIPATVDMAPVKEEVSIRSDVQVATRELSPSIASRREIEGEVLEKGEYEIQARLGMEGRERTESTYGTVVTPGELSTLPRQAEKESPFGKRPLAIMIDNARDSRPQSGLEKANVVYEVLAEGGITRFLAIFATQEADKVGPVRSARPYFITKTLEHNAIYVHAGESPDAAIFIKEERIDDINELVHFQPFWRTSDRKPPHNLYTSTERLRDEARRLGYIEMVNKDDYQFEIDSNEVLTGKEINKINIKYNVNYEVSYQYMPEIQRYVRFLNGNPHIDAETGRQLQVKNIIIQASDKKILDTEGRLAIDFIGKGAGLIIYNGKSEEITWSKEALESKTYFFNKDGNRLAIQPGNVWIQVVHPDTEINY